MYVINYTYFNRDQFDSKHIIWFATLSVKNYRIYNVNVMYLNGLWC